MELKLGFVILVVMWALLLALNVVGHRVYKSRRPNGQIEKFPPDHLVFPHTAVVAYDSMNKTSYCNAVIISHEHVITAVSCFRDHRYKRTHFLMPFNVKVLVGDDITNATSNNHTGQSGHNVVGLYAATEYGIFVLELETAIEFVREGSSKRAVQSVILGSDEGSNEESGREDFLASWKMPNNPPLTESDRPVLNEYELIITGCSYDFGPFAFCAQSQDDSMIELCEGSYGSAMVKYKGVTLSGSVFELVGILVKLDEENGSHGSGPCHNTNSKLVFMKPSKSYLDSVTGGRMNPTRSLRGARGGRLRASFANK